jgi:hypothetical protein
LAELVMATHAGMSTADFEAIASAWLDGARHPRFGRRPMGRIFAFEPWRGTVWTA